MGTIQKYFFFSWYNSMNGEKILTVTVVLF